MTNQLPSAVQPEIENLPEELVFFGGFVVDVLNDRVFKADMVISSGVISYIGSNAKHTDSAKKIDITGKFIAPGFFDMHVHFREPGNELAEDIISGSNAAMAGGFTGVGMMPNTIPAIDNAELLKLLESKAESHLVEVHAIPAVTCLRSGETLTDMHSLVQAGALAFTDDGNGLQKGEVMKKALLTAGLLSKPLLVHSEDESFAQGVINESSVSKALGIPGISNLSESVMIGRDILIAESLNSAVHFQHVSTREGVELIRRAKRAGTRVTAETAPHYFSLTDEKLRSRSPDYKMKPPLRTTQDVGEIIRGLQDNTIEVIATDHAPHLKSAKDLGLMKAPFGVTGLETALVIGIKYLVEPGYLSLVQLIKKLSVGARKILGLDFELLQIGKSANLTVFDTVSEWKVDSSLFYTKSANSAFNGEIVKGRVHIVINKNKIWIR